MKTGTCSGGIRIRLPFSVSPDATYRQSAKSGNCFNFCYSDNLLLLSLLHSFRFENLYSELLTSISHDSRFIHAQVYSSTLWIYWFLNSLSPGKILNYSANIKPERIYWYFAERTLLILELYLMTKLKIHKCHLFETTRCIWRSGHWILFSSFDTFGSIEFLILNLIRNKIHIHRTS